VLDVGCGTGGPARHLAGLGAVVTGITTSEVGVATATELAATAGLSDRNTFEVRDGTDNGLPDASFDRVWVLESSHLMRERARLIGECARVLRPGGRVTLCDILLQRPMPFDEVRRLRVPLAVLRAVFGDARMELRSTYEDLFAAAGIDVDTSIDLTAATRPTFDRWRANARDHREECLAAFGQESLDQFVESCDILEGFWDDGTLGYGLVAGAKPS
jgi:27-O-demethylrifamycin SV methyltransferase